MEFKRHWFKDSWFCLEWKRVRRTRADTAFANLWRLHHNSLDRSPQMQGGWIYLQQHALLTPALSLWWRGQLWWREWRSLLPELHRLLLRPDGRLPVQRQGVRRASGLQRQPGRVSGTLRSSWTAWPGVWLVCAFWVSVRRRSVHLSGLSLWQHERLFWWQRWEELR